MIADDNPKNSSEQQKVSSEPGLKEKFRVEDSSPIKPVQDYTTAKQKDEKHVWVKVSVEKTEVENFQETKKNVSSGTITINVEDENKKDFTGRDYQQDEKKENPGLKSHNVSNESSQPTENKTSLHTQNNNTNRESRRQFHMLLLQQRFQLDQRCGNLAGVNSHGEIIFFRVSLKTI